MKIKRLEKVSVKNCLQQEFKNLRPQHYYITVVSIPPCLFPIRSIVLYQINIGNNFNAKYFKNYKPLAPKTRYN